MRTHILARSALMAGFLCTAPLPMFAQRIRVAISMTDSVGVISSALSSALRGLGDIDVVTVGENPRLILAGVVMCNPQDSCRDATGYVVALRLYRPFTMNTAETIVPLLPTGSGLQAPADSVSRTLYRYLKNYTYEYSQWVLSWGRNRFESAARSFIAQIDTECLAALRAWDRVSVGPTSEATTRFEAYMKFLSSRSDWICE
jgi:hypothetical protein